jgi:hypothetical protein
VFLVVSSLTAGVATAEASFTSCAVPSSDARVKTTRASEPGQGPELKVRTGVEKDRVWLAAEYEGLRVNKFTAKGGSSVLEFRYRNDQVVFQFSEGGTTIIRNRKRLTADGQNGEAVQRLLGNSVAMFRARMMLSELETTSALSAQEMSLLAAMAMATSLTGDTHAPRRLTERFAARHFGRLRPIAFEPKDSCWTSYSKEVDAAAVDHHDCAKEAVESGGIWRDFRIHACSTIWILRVESAWFEFLSCLSPLNILPKIVG